MQGNEMKDGLLKNRHPTIFWTEKNTKVQLNTPA